MPLRRKFVSLPPIRLLAAILLSMAFPVQAADEIPGGETVEKVITITFGYPASVFAGVNAQDAKAATKVWGDRMMAKQGIRYIADVIVYDDVDTMVREVRAGRLNMFTIPSFDYISHVEEFDAMPVACSVTNDFDSMKYLLLVRKDSAIADLAGLRNRSVIIAPIDAGIVPEAWLNVQLFQSGLPFADQFFGNMRVVAKPNRAVLPVFFKQADACLVRKDSFKLLAELNPQMSQQLVALAESPFYLNGLLCFSNQFDPQERDRMVNKLIEMDQLPEGQQILNLFRVDKCIPFKPELLTSVEGLLNEYEAATTKAGRRPTTFFLNQVEP